MEIHFRFEVFLKKIVSILEVKMEGKCCCHHNQQCKVDKISEKKTRNKMNSSKS